MYISESNTLREEIKKLLSLCDKAVEECGENASFFDKPVEDINKR